MSQTILQEGSRETEARCRFRPALSAKDRQSRDLSSAVARHNPTRRIVGIAIAVAVLTMAYGPLLVEFVAWQQKRPHYHASMFPLLAFFALLGWRSFSAERRATCPPSSLLTRAFLSAAWMLLAGAVLLHSPFVACLSAILLAGAVCSEIRSRREVSNLWGIWALLLLVVPIPLGQDQLLIARLQLWSSQLCSRGLERLGVLHLMEGNTLWLAGGELFVDEACSGIVSVLLVVSLAAVYGVARNRPAVHVVLLAASGVVWATLLNAVRIGTIAVALDWYQFDWATGWPHEMVGALTALLAIGATVATDQLLLVLLAPIVLACEDVTAQPIGRGRGMATAWDCLVQIGPRSTPNRGELSRQPVNSDLAQPFLFWSARHLARGLLPFVFVGGLSWVLPAPDRGDDLTDSLEHPSIVRALALNSETLPKEWAGATLVGHQLQQRDSRHQFGEYSSIFEYRADDGTPLVVSCDFPFPGGWHELSVCYQGIGWELLRRQVESDPTGKHVELHFRLPNGERAVVLYSNFSSGGESIEPPAQTIADAFGRALERRRPTRASEHVFQVQVIARSNGDYPLRDDHLGMARQLLAVAEEQFLQHILLSPTP